MTEAEREVAKAKEDVARLAKIGDEASWRYSVRNAAASRNAERITRIAEQLDQIADHTDLRPGERATMAYSRMERAIECVFQHPTKQCIAATKRAVIRLIDTILDDDETTRAFVHSRRMDAATHIHSTNVGVLGLALAKRMYPAGSDHNVAEIGAGLFLHDLGKACLDPAVATKAGPLGQRDWVGMRSHPFWSYALLNQAGHATEECSVIALQHHEREDGSGYPEGLVGAEIHPYARLCSIADVFDALVSHRPYRAALPVDQALHVMRDEMLSHFRKHLMENLIKVVCTEKRK